MINPQKFKSRSIISLVLVLIILGFYFTYTNYGKVYKSDHLNLVAIYPQSWHAKEFDRTHPVVEFRHNSHFFVADSPTVQLSCPLFYEDTRLYDEVWAQEKVKHAVTVIQNEYGSANVRIKIPSVVHNTENAFRVTTLVSVYIEDEEEQTLGIAISDKLKLGDFEISYYVNTTNNQYLKVISSFSSNDRLNAQALEIASSIQLKESAPSGVWCSLNWKNAVEVAP